MNVFEYAAREEKYFEALAQESGYERKTTFFSDLSIAECYGIKSIKDTYRRVKKHWLDDITYITEFCMCLNWKSWEWGERGNGELTKLYTKLYYELDELITSHYESRPNELEYYYTTTD